MMEAHPSSSSSDDEEDRRHLIEQNDRRNRPHSPAATFELEKSRFHTPNFNHINKRYLFAFLLLPLFILILYFSTDIKDLFQTSLTSRPESSSIISRMRESELRALYLLRQQQSGLLQLLPHTDNNNTDFTSAYNVTYSDLLAHISLNKQIQQALLSSHQLGADLFTLNGSDSGPSSLFRCGKVDQSVNSSDKRRSVEWNPKPDKYLFAVCVSGQMSNHLICLEKHMFFAALLNRVLVIPSSKVDYEFHRVLDIDHINKCLGRRVVVTFEEFEEAERKKKSKVHIDKFICYFSLPDLCYMDDERVKKLKNLGVSMGGKLESPWSEDVKKPKKRTVEDVLSKFSSGEDVIAIGDVFFAEVESEWVMQPGGPIAHTCKTLIEPSRLIMLTAQRFVQTFLGRDFVALHLRRHGFLKFCNDKQPSCFYPIPQAADCINRVLERANTPVIYLSTDAAESETGLLQSLLFINGKTVPLVTRPARNSAEKWDALLYRHGLEGDSQVRVLMACDFSLFVCNLFSLIIHA
ncbi:OLC1v1015264C3 [Oldenlandia corymbosa var. corymbosa]|uniref:O-fucosyltransferase family protein n=1 Tax=Oldenlandia corymbosa var. corymbosa TaxID=529605 RepID=A0AAV1E380_OLDCO|nr:OLC1v1015264C3 [Oldenlandia corymbosa var. corymbosa]